MILPLMTRVPQVADLFKYFTKLNSKVRDSTYFLFAKVKNLKKVQYKLIDYYFIEN